MLNSILLTAALFGTPALASQNIETTADGSLWDFIEAPTPPKDADAHDAAIVSFVFSSGRFKKGLSFPRGTRVRWTRGGKARGERGDADAGLEAKRGVPEGRPTLVTFVARARARSASGPRDASISFQTRRR